MKMLKKAAAVLLAAAMSLTMLTACGGGSGSGVGGGIPESGSYTMETTMVENTDGPVTQNNRYYVTSNGTWYYYEQTSGTHASASLSNMKTGEHYVINPTNNKAWKAESSSAGGEDGNEEVGGKVTATKTSGTWKYNEKTYTTLEVTYTAADFTQTVKYCYDGATLAYIETTGKDEGGRYYSLEKVTKYEKAANESKLNPNNYKLVKSSDDLF